MKTHHCKYNENHRVKIWTDGCYFMLSLVIKQLQQEVNHWPLFSPAVKNIWTFISTPPIYLHGMVPRHNFTFSPLWILHNILLTDCKHIIIIIIMQKVKPISEIMTTVAVHCFSKLNILHVAGSCEYCNEPPSSIKGRGCILQKYIG